METGFLFRISAFAAESITFCITAAMRIGTGYIDGSCGAFAVLIVGAVRITSICTFDTDGSPGAERIFVIAAVVCGAFKTCHKSVLLIIMILPETVSLPECASCLIVSTAVRLDRFRCCIVCPEEEKFILKK